MQVTLLTNQHGDFEVHLGGCSDIKKTARRYPERVESFEGGSLAEALIALDTEAAAWFGQEPYTQEARDNGCWSVTNGILPSPCVVKAQRSAGLTFSSEGRPIA